MPASMFCLLTLLLFGSLVSLATGKSHFTALSFYEEPHDIYYVSATSPAILKCQIENARTGFFKCNGKWSSYDSSSNSNIVQVN